MDVFSFSRPALYKTHVRIFKEVRESKTDICLSAAINWMYMKPNNIHSIHSVPIISVYLPDHSKLSREKSKMAKAGDKKRIESNRKHIQILQFTIAISNVFFILFKFLLNSPTLWHWIALASTTLLFTFTYNFIARSLAPHYSPQTGECIFPGSDPSKGGPISYFHDVLYLTAAAQFGGAFTNYAWLVLLLIPGYALLKLATLVLIPWMSGSSHSSSYVPKETEMDRKRREKKERQATRAEKFRR
jgi:hypothetical protein